MLHSFGERQQALLRALQAHKTGRTVDELVQALGITRTAVNQHLAALSRDGYIARDRLVNTGGRPGYAYVLTSRGLELFPRQYAWFSGLLLESLKAELGSGEAERLLARLGAKLAGEHRERIQALPAGERVAEVARLMSALGYEARADTGEGSTPAINACNCVYHHLAREHNEVCRFDTAFLSTLLDADIEHSECMARDDHRCRFKIHKKT